jgi:predicted AlkP superfamily pyrophosphatase or phosphodiesterase
VASLLPSPSLSDGEEGSAGILVRESGVQDRLTLRAKIRNRPKVYFVALDACGPDYLTLGRNGDPHAGVGERLMPKSHEFLGEAALLSQASGVLPASTDSNHLAALTGSWPGTLGVFSVRQHYFGEREGRGVLGVGSKSLLRWGVDGLPIRSIFDVARDPASGGDPEVFSAVIVGKAWLGEYFRDEGGTVALIGSGKRFPDYVPPPEPFRLGDPVSDPDAKTDREGTNLYPRAVQKMFNPLARAFATYPSVFPDDRWVAEAVVRIINAEDPDYFFVVLPEIDTVQHVFGAADDPSLWDKRGTPSVLWDDVNAFNPNANRDPVLDVVYEADQSFGLIVDSLRSRGVFDDSLVVLFSDHGASTPSNRPESIIDVGAVLSQNGMTSPQIERLSSSSQLSWIALTNPNDADEVERILESYLAPDPLTGNLVHPFLVVTRREMESGVDGRLGAIARDGSSRGELYSAWSIERPATDNSKVRWPDLFVFSLAPFQPSVDKTTTIDDVENNLTVYVGNHSSPGTDRVLLAVHGPGVRRGVFPGKANLVDVAPTLYEILGFSRPAHVDGQVLEQILRR